MDKIFEILIYGILAGFSGGVTFSMRKIWKDYQAALKENKRLHAKCSKLATEYNRRTAEINNKVMLVNHRSELLDEGFAALREYDRENNRHSIYRRHNNNLNICKN